VLVSLYPLGKAVGLLGTNCVYWLKTPDGTAVVGHIRPKLVLKDNTLVIKFVYVSKSLKNIPKDK
jgi:hypothetical protein